MNINKNTYYLAAQIFIGVAVLLLLCTLLFSFPWILWFGCLVVAIVYFVWGSRFKDQV
ncbi:MAG: hypothetical protein ACFBSC_03295 [Microcoleaceae cyanobacterium]